MCNKWRCHNITFQILKSVQKCDPVSAYLFILCLEILFMIIKNNEDIKNLKILGNTFLYTAYAGDTTFP